MDSRLHRLHLLAGQAAGKERTCGTKVKYETEELAVKAANSINKSNNRKHINEAYPCPFCGKWHIGREMSEQELKNYE